jgi:probable F420-dependent oxidoreductase
MTNSGDKIRVGLGLGLGRLVKGRGCLTEIVDTLEALEFDSLWTSDVPGSHALDPLTVLTFAAARTQRLKLGTAVLPVPGLQPARLAKAMASLDILSDGRFFPVLGLGTADSDALGAQGVTREDRGPMTEEMLPLLRRIWAEDVVDHDGRYFHLTHYRPHIHPVRRSIPLWLGGRSSSELRRTGRLADGWLASFARPDEVSESIQVIEAAAAEAGRAIASDHFGALLLYTLEPVTEEVSDFVRWRRPDCMISDVFPVGAEAVNRLLTKFVAAGATKFVLIPAVRPASWTRELEELRDVVSYVRGSEVGAA